MNCASELTLSIYADGELPREEATQVATHLETCADCSALFSALEVENAALVEVLSEAEAEDVVPVADSSLWAWLWGSVAVCALTPVMLDGLVQMLPSLPPGLSWLKTLGLREASYGLLHALFNAFVGVDVMLVPMIGFVVTLIVVLALLGLPTLHRLAVAGVGGGMALALLLTFVAPATAHAIDIRTEDGGSVTVAVGESIDDTVFLSGDTALVEGVVNGDVFAFAERVEITGTVNGSVYSGAKTLMISGKVSGNVHVIGGEVDLAGTIGGSTYVLGENVIVAESGVLSRGGALAVESVRVKGRVGHGLLIAAERAGIDGRVENSVKGYVGHLTVSSTGSIGGNLEVTVPSEERVDIDEGATVAGSTKINIKEMEKNDFLRWQFYLVLLARVLGLLIFGSLIVTLFPSLIPRLPESNPEILRNMGIGFVVMVATPVAMILAAITVIGIPISILLGMFFAVMAYIATLVVAYFVALRFLGSDNKRVVLGTALSVLIILIVVELPLVGLGLNFLVHLLGMGCLLVHLKNRYVASRSDPGGVAMTTTAT